MLVVQCYNIIVPQRKGGEYMGLKKGTKLTKNPKEFILRVRIDQKTIDMLNTACEQQDKSRSELVRDAINKHVKRGKSDERRTNQTSSDNEESC